MRCSVIAAAAALAAGCLALPPSRTEVSAVAHGGGSGLRVSTGGHAASLPARLDMPVDLGAGYVYERVGDDDAPAQHGSYLELGAQVWRRGRHRAFAAARVDVFWNDVGDAGTTRAIGARVGIESVAGHVAGGSRDRGGGVAAYGVFAPGLFVEGGARALEGGRAVGTVIVGVSVRLPFVIAASRPHVF